jgi:branched-chain amino acid transport system permease protein
MTADIDWLLLFEVTLAGLGSGGLYALAGLAFVLIYKATRVVNLAIGEMMMMGAYFMFAAASQLGWPIWTGIVLAIVGSGLLGMLVERVLIRPMLGESPISVFMVTVGLSSILVGAVELIWGADQLRLPSFMPSDPVLIGDAMVAPKIFYGFLVAAGLIAAVLLTFRRWRGGVALRATASDQAAAYSMGIDVPRVFSLTWAVAAMVAAVAGIIVGSISSLSPTMGVFGLAVLVVVIVGGLDSVAGALVGGLLVGLIESWTGMYLGGEFKLVATFSLLVLVLMVRPYGLFGSRQIERL